MRAASKLKHEKGAIKRLLISVSEKTQEPNKFDWKETKQEINKVSRRLFVKELESGRIRASGKRKHRRAIQIHKECVECDQLLEREFRKSGGGVTRVYAE